MSKKKSKPAPRKAAKKAPMKASKKAPKKAARKSVATPRPSSRLSGAAGNSRTLNVTIFLFRTGNGNRIRTSPQRLYANPGDSVEWNVVNLIDGSDVPVTITWPEGGPWGKDPIQIRSWERMPFGEASGRFKFMVAALDAQEDPEVEIPEGN
jgi:hypothetical protein